MITYKDAGVDVERGYEAVRRMKILHRNHDDAAPRYSDRNPGNGRSRSYW